MSYGHNYQDEVTIEQVREFVETQLEDEILSMHFANDKAEYMRKHMTLLHSLIIGDVSLDTALEQMKDIEL